MWQEDLSPSLHTGTNTSFIQSCGISVPYNCSQFLQVISVSNKGIHKLAKILEGIFKFYVLERRHEASSILPQTTGVTCEPHCCLVLSSQWILVHTEKKNAIIILKKLCTATQNLVTCDLCTPNPTRTHISPMLVYSLVIPSVVVTMDALSCDPPLITQQMYC